MRYCECPECGAHLDPGERCDCQKKREAAPAATGTTSRKITRCQYISPWDCSQGAGIFTEGEPCDEED